MDTRAKTVDTRKKQQGTVQEGTETTTNDEVDSAAVKDYSVKQYTKKDGRYKKGASEDLVLNINQMGVKIFDGSLPLDTLRYAELSTWEFNDQTLELTITRKIEGGKKRDSRGPSACRFVCEDDAQGHEIIEEMSKVAKLMAGQMRAEAERQKARVKAEAERQQAKAKCQLRQDKGLC